jgi:hypothetical protein
MEDRLEYLNRLARGEVSDASVSTSDSSSEEDSSDEEVDSEDEEGVESRRLEEGAVPMGEATRYATYIPEKKTNPPTHNVFCQCTNTPKKCAWRCTSRVSDSLLRRPSPGARGAAVWRC